MLRESSFIWALSLSLAGHMSFFFLVPSYFNPIERIVPKIEDVEVTYFEIGGVPEWENIPPSVVQAAPLASRAGGSPMAPSVPAYPFGIPKPRLVERSVTTQNGRGKERGSFQEEALYQEMNTQLKDPVFATYYQAIREKIRKSAKRRYEGKRDSGDVSLGFTLFSNGRLKEVSVLRETAQVVSNLRAVAVQSLVDAAPFPPFPEHFEREQLSFLVVLTFEPKP